MNLTVEILEDQMIVIHNNFQNAKFEKCFKLLGDELSSPFLSNVIGEHYNFLNFDKYYKDNYYKILATFIVVNDEDCIPNLICY